MNMSNGIQAACFGKPNDDSRCIQAVSVCVYMYPGSGIRIEKKIRYIKGFKGPFFCVYRPWLSCGIQRTMSTVAYGSIV